MRNSLSVRNLILSITATVALCYFMEKSPSPKIIFIPFLISSLSMAGKCIARICNKKKLELVFGKMFAVGFLLFFIGFLMVASYISIRDKNYGMLIFSILFWIVGACFVKKRFGNKRGIKSGESGFAFAIIVSAVLVLIAFLVGIYLLILGFKDANLVSVFGGIIFTFGSLAFVLAALTMQGCFDKIKIDVLGLYAGIVFVVIGMGFIVIKFIESFSLMETIKAFGLWIIIPILMAVVGVIQILKCFKNSKQ